MPIYEYDCPVCGKIEVIQKVSEAPLTECPQCEEAGKKTKIEKSVSASSFHLKGTGWYKTDYTSSSTPKKESKIKGEKVTKTEEKKAETTTDAKKCGTGCGCH